jgi:transcriptional regulator with XRE-family HTH domain
MKDQKHKIRNEALGDYLRARRTELGLSFQQVADQTGLHFSYLVKLEHGQYERPAPKYLRIMAGALDIPLDDLLALAGYDQPERLPSFTPYLRAKYELPPEAVADLERYFEMLRAYYDIPKDQPVFPPKPNTNDGGGSDEADEDRRAA